MGPSERQGYPESCPSHLHMFSSVQFSRSVMSDSWWPHEPQHARSPCPSPTPGVYSNSCPSSWWCHPSNHLILCHPLLLLFPIPPSIRVFSNESTLPMRWPKYWSFSFSISPSNEHPGLISFRIDWLDFLAVQGTLKSLLQHHSSKASILRHSAFLTVQLSHPYMTTGKTIALTTWTFDGKVMSLLLNMLSRLVITFLPRSKCLLISWLHDVQTSIFWISAKYIWKEPSLQPPEAQDNWWPSVPGAEHALGTGCRVLGSWDREKDQGSSLHLHPAICAVFRPWTWKCGRVCCWVVRWDLLQQCILS